MSGSLCPTCGQAMPDTTTLGGFLRVRRDQLKLTLRRVEAITDGKVSNAYLSQLETGKIDSPSGAILYHLAAAYALDAAGLLRLAVGKPYEEEESPFGPIGAGPGIRSFNEAKAP